MRRPNVLSMKSYVNCTLNAIVTNPAKLSVRGSVYLTNRAERQRHFDWGTQNRPLTAIKQKGTFIEQA